MVKKAQSRIKKKLVVSLRDLVSKDILIIVASTLIFSIINYIYFCTHHSLAPDAVGVGAQHIANGWEVSLGRWLIPIVDSARGGLVVPGLILTSGIFSLTVAIILLAKIFAIKKTASLIILSAVIVFFPTFSESVLFVYCYDSYCLAMLFSVLAGYFMCTKKGYLKCYGLPIFFMILSLGLYQAYVGVTISIIFFVSLKDMINSDIRTKDVMLIMLRRILCLVLGLILYYVTTKIIGKIVHVSASSYKGADSSVADIIFNFGDGTLSAYRDFMIFFFADKNHVFRDVLNVGISLVTVAVIFVRVLKKTE